MTGMTQPAPAASARFPVTTALELHGMTVERDLGLAFGPVVRSMGALKTMSAGLKAITTTTGRDASDVSARRRNTE